MKVAGHDGDAAKVGVNAIRSKYPGRGQPLQAVVEVVEALGAEAMPAEQVVKSARF